MTEREIEAEVERVGALVREFLADVELHAEGRSYDNVRVKTWMVGAMVLAQDEEGDTREIVTSAYETSSRVVQTGMTVRLADLARNMGEIYG